MKAGGRRAVREDAGEVELHPFPSPSTPTSRATEASSALLISSLQSLRERGLFDRYRTHLAEGDAKRILGAVVGEWVPVTLLAAHYAAADRLGLTPNEVVEAGVLVGDKIQATVLGTILRVARASGVTPWAAIANFQRLYERMFRGGGGTRVVKLGPKEARLEIAGLPLAHIAYFRGGTMGMIKGAGELFCERMFVREVPDKRTTTSVAYRCMWA